MVGGGCSLPRRTHTPPSFAPPLRVCQRLSPPCLSTASAAFLPLYLYYPAVLVSNPRRPPFQPCTLLLKTPSRSDPLFRSPFPFPIGWSFTKTRLVPPFPISPSPTDRSSPLSSLLNGPNFPPLLSSPSPLASFQPIPCVAIVYCRYALS